MPPSLQISIPSTSISSEPGSSKQYTLYSISLRQPLRSYVVQKRYSDFTKLHEVLTSQAAQEPPHPLPKKSWLKSTTSSPELTETRRQGLEAYLQAINNAADPRWRQCEAWRIFLNLPSNASGANEARPGTTAAGGLGAKQADLESVRMDPSIWLDVHRDLKSQLGEARQALRRRDAATSAAAQHDAGAEVKRWLVRSAALISTLEEALALSSSGNSQENGPRKGEKGETKSTTPQLGEGEVRRRKDLISAAKKERVTLERQLTSYTLKSAAAGSTASATPSAEQKEGLLQPQPQQSQQLLQQTQRPGVSNNRQSSNTNTSRRVLGAPVKETERTRELDNDGVLQLQRQIMEEQDMDVTDLTAAVRRMREMGVQINDELTLQSKMLDLLGDDADRVAGKIDVAKKRIGKIN